MKTAPKIAVIAVAGFGTRMLPITKSIEKCMLPVNNRPVVDYIVEDCIESGIKKIIFIVGEDHYQLQTYYGENKKLYKHLASSGKEQELITLKNIGESIDTIYEVQPMGDKHGTAIPLGLAKKHLTGEDNFLYFSGDDFFLYKQMPSTAKLIEDWLGSTNRHALIGAAKPTSELSRYGVLDIGQDGSFKQIVEKPSALGAPSNFINVSRYLFEKTIFKYLDRLEPSVNGEYYITDAINLAVQAGDGVLVSKNEDEWLDCGNLNGWLHANQSVVNNHQNNS